jgi:hypothetical protein
VKDAQIGLQISITWTKMEEDAIMGENVCWELVTTSNVKDTYLNKACMQSHYVWKMSRVQKHCPSLLW